MFHIAIMKKSWKLTQEIALEKKTIETRWYKSKRIPWDKVNKGDIIYFKDSGNLITVSAVVDSVEQYSDLTREKTKKIINQVWKEDVVVKEKKVHLEAYAKDKKYCIIIKLKDPKLVPEPFDINKKGFGSQSAWITIDDIKNIIKS